MNGYLEEPWRDAAGEWAKVVLRGIGQVMFQGHALSGLLFLGGIAVASPLMAAAGLVGAAIGTATARLLKYDDGEVRDGIYGFNATLVGVATFFFLKPLASVFVLMAVFCAASAVVTWLMRRYVPFPTYTAPFIVTTWVLVAVASLFHEPRVPPSSPPPDSLDVAAALMEGLSEVFLQANRVTGVLFIAALAVSNWRHAALGLAGSVIGMLVGLYHGDPYGNVSIGIYGYNAALAAIALYLWRPSLLVPLLGILVSTPITEFFPLTGLPTLTAPFVLACWLVIAVGSLERYFVAKKG